jgi:hypothetical protein
MKISCICYFFLLAMYNNVVFADESEETKKYPKSSDAGMHRSLTSDVWGFVPLSTAPGVNTSPRCAGRKSTYSVEKNDQSKDYVVVEFYTIVTPKHKDTCPDPILPENDSRYKIARDIYNTIDEKYNGLAFGGLFVPFKFRLGSDKKLVNSVTAAPYLGLRYSWLQFYGYEIKPIVSAGIASVSVPNNEGNGNETKAAFSSSFGIMLSSENESAFSAGILFGKDFLSKSERKNDPSVVKPWLSVWLGVPIP